MNILSEIASMEELQPLPVAAFTPECKCCFGKINEADQFCQACGFPLKGSDEEQSQFFYNRNYQHMEMDGLKKKVQSARTTLYVLAGYFLLAGLVLFAMNKSNDSAAGMLISNAVVAVIFLALGIWADKKPVASIISGMVLYILVILMSIFQDPTNIIKGIILKIIIISYLVKGLMSALEAEKIRKQYNI